MSLSSWLRDYLYIPLGGNRLGSVRTYVNLMLTMLLGGLWHGAAWRFVAWGGLHGGALAVERFWGARDRPPAGPLRRALGTVLTFHFVCLGWVFFRAPGFDAALAVLGRIASGFPLAMLGAFQRGYPFILPLLALGVALHALPAGTEERFDRVYARAPLPLQAAWLAGAILLALQAQGAAIQPYIYFSF